MAAEPISPEPRQVSIPKPRPLWIRAAGIATVGVAFLAAAAWWIGGPGNGSYEQVATSHHYSIGSTSNEPAALLGELEKIAEIYKIVVVTADLGFPVKTTYGMIDGKIAEGPQLQDYASLFAPEFTLYPPDLLLRSQLKRVVLCNELSFAGQRRNAIPDFEHDTLYLDVSRGAFSKPYLRKVIHHEFFHVIDYRDDGSVYQDERWAALNSGDFKYGNGGRAAQDLWETSVLTNKFPGFLNHYSTTGVEEDKAELFANLIVDLEYVESRARNDHVIETKIERMKELLARFCPEMNDEFWDKVRKMKRSDK